MKESTNWKTLYRLGGFAPLLTLVFYLSQFILIRWEQYPTDTVGWFSLFQHSRLTGLFYLNALDIFSITFLGVLFLALYTALKPVNPSWITTAAFFGLMGVVVFVIPRVAMLSMLPLSERYSITTDEIERTRLLTAGETLGALGTPTPHTIGFLLMAVAVFIISIVMLSENRMFRVIVPIFGVLASLLTILNHLSLLLAPALSDILMIASGLFWIPWWIFTGLGLLRLADN